MRITRLLVANRGEIACRIIRTATELGIETVAVYSRDDASGAHVRRADQAVALGLDGPAAYLDAERLVAIAVEKGCEALHPGYGFLAESPRLADACQAAGIVFVGPDARSLTLFGDKTEARRMALEHSIPVLPASPGVSSVQEGLEFARSLPEGTAVMIKSAHGGGGRGIEAVSDLGRFAAAFERCASIAASSSGSADLFVERMVVRARHIEVQVVGDSVGGVSDLGTRDCSLQRQNAKLIEIAPAPHLDADLEATMRQQARALMRAGGGVGLVTMEFLVDLDSGEHFFLEANPRLQVEHTVTEEVTGLDLIAIQLALASGATLADLDLVTSPEPRGRAMQVRINSETMGADTTVTPSVGTVGRFEVPLGRGVRVDTHLFGGYEIPVRFDSLIVKIIVHTLSPDGRALWSKAETAVSELVVEGIETNAAFLERLLGRVGDSSDGPATTRTVEGLAPIIVGEIVPGRAEADSDRYASPGRLFAETSGVVVEILVSPGTEVSEGQAVLVVEAMKMEHLVASPASGVVRTVAVKAGDPVTVGQRLADVEPGDVAEEIPSEAGDLDLDSIRPDLAEVIERHEVGLDHRRTEAIAKRHDRGRRSARENVNDLVDPGTFVEIGPLVVAAQRRRKSMEELIARTPGDGMVGGFGSVNGELHPERCQTVVVTYDYTVMAGTQGYQNHRKKDRLFEQAANLRLPVILMAEGGGGRPGDSDPVLVAALDCMAFRLFGELSGLVPLVGINTGYCFAGNAALLGCCDVIIATPDSNVGMGGPAMIEGGGLGTFHPSEVGPADVQVSNGVIDVLVADDAEAMATAKRYLSYFQGPLADWVVADQRKLRHLIPENRLRIYDVRLVIETLFDVDSVLELRAGYGLGMITALARVEGRPVGVIANNPAHNAGAIDAKGSDKASRFMQLCDAFDLPIVNLCDTPGFMVGPEVEAEGLVRRASRMFVVGANLDVPVVTVVLRKGYGLGAQAMAGGSFKSPIFTVAWPTSEFGAMGLEGAVKLGFRAELEAISDPAEREAAYDKMVDRMYEIGKGTSMADHFEIDDVIDPADTRRWIMAALRSAGPPPPRSGGKRPNVDTW